MSNVKQELLERFSSEEKCGIYYEDVSTGIRQEDVDPSLHDSNEYEFYAYLPSGEEMGRCTNCANWIKEIYGDRADVYGFMVEDNPKCTSKALGIGGGHDFVLIDQQYIVDIWISHYTGEEKQYVFDLQDRNDFQKITEIFGDPRKWSYLDGEFISPYSSDYPKDKRVRIGQANDVSLSM